MQVWFRGSMGFQGTGIYLLAWGWTVSSFVSVVLGFFCLGFRQGLDVLRLGGSC